ncbi:MAG: hypothetical protein DWQ02_13075 [Bacteroidetes bacterium]|nr:MAG: hypothetical protein DWQ02_13075 [Bacteroidota bacterium]
MTKYFIFSATICMTFFLLSCSPESPKNSDSENIKEQVDSQTEEKIATAIINSAIQKAGLDQLGQSFVEFDFRDKHYSYLKTGGKYKYERSFTDKEGKQIKDELNNTGFNRWTDGDSTVLEDKKARAYAYSVNSVIYFAFLPYSLNDPAVISEHLGKVDINGKSYNKIKVTFKEEGGGDDFEDTFIYWFNTETYNMDYLAYEYHTDGGGMRFREAFNPRKINGVLIQDYKNYKPKTKGSISIENIDKAFESDELELLSEIVLENVQVELN